MLSLVQEEILSYGKTIDFRLSKAADIAAIPKAEAETWDEKKLEEWREAQLIAPSKWLNLYGPYETQPIEPAARFRLYKHYNAGPQSRQRDSLFRPIDRQRIILGIMQELEELGGAGMNITSMIGSKSEALKAVFPLHDEKYLAPLRLEWVSLNPTKRFITQPLDDIRNYFGEKIAFYFAFLEMYCAWLIPMALLGFGSFFAQIHTDRIDNIWSIAYAFLLGLWATLLLEQWKRKESMLRVQWGMMSFFEKERMRPEFVGIHIRDPTNGELTKHFPWVRRLGRILVGSGVITTLIASVLITMIGLSLYRAELKKTMTSQQANIYVSILSAVQINIFNIIYGVVAKTLNNWENYKTDSSFENGLITKNFIFKFINSYNSLFYLVYFKGFDDGMMTDIQKVAKAAYPAHGVNACSYDYNHDGKFGYLTDDTSQPVPQEFTGCLRELRLQLAIIFGTQVFLNNFLELAIPKLKNCLASRKQKSAASLVEKQQQLSEAERQYGMVEYNLLLDYDELAVQYGFVTLFASAFPLAPLFALASNFFELRLDAFKLCSLARKPAPKGAYNIGQWFAVFETIGFIAVLTNVSLVIFKFPSISVEFCDNNPVERWTLFVIVEHVCMLIKLGIGYFVPDEPGEVGIHRERQEYIIDVLINGIPEDKDPVQRKEPRKIEPMNFADLRKTIPSYEELDKALDEAAAAAAVAAAGGAEDE